MKRMLLIMLLGIMAAVNTIYGASNNIENRKLSEKEIIKLMADEREISRIIDNFAIYADKKDYESQKMLFTEDAVVKINLANGQVNVLRGREEISKTFETSMARNNPVYHMNGQRVIDVNGNSATATSYCYTILISENDKGEKMKRSLYVRYEDKFVFKNNKWFMSERNSYFVHADTENLGK